METDWIFTAMNSYCYWVNIFPRTTIMLPDKKTVNFVNVVSFWFQSIFHTIHQFTIVRVLSLSIYSFVSQLSL